MTLPPDVLDELARCFARAAVKALLRDVQLEEETRQGECARDHNVVPPQEVSTCRKLLEDR